jgi:lipopolysaccharide biosynthesis protein
MENKKHAIILHLYYNDLWEEFKAKFEPILNRGDVDLYVSFTKEDTSKKSEVEKLTPFVYVLENKGLDIGPFIFILNEIKDKNYTSITKIHSKKSLKHSQPVGFGETWRAYLVNSLLGNPEIYSNIVDTIEQNPISMIGNSNFLYDFNRDSINIPHHYEVIHSTIKQLNVEIKETTINNSTCFSKTGRFFAGTMFATSHQYLKELFKNTNLLEFYETLPLGYSYNSNAHAMERIFGYYIEQLDGNYYTT